MKRILLIPAMALITSMSNAQTIIVYEDFESYNVAQQLGAQSTLWETWTGSNGGTDDAYITNDFALSGSKSLRIKIGNDMILPIGNYTSGRFIIEFNAYMVDDAYFSIMHICQSSKAFELYLNSANQIKYLDEPGASANSVTIDSYANDEWVNFRFDIDIDLDSVTTYINNVKRHQSVFSNAVAGSPSSGLSCINFYGLANFNGVNYSNYRVDDITITDMNTANIVENQVPDISVFPNPSAGKFEVKCDEIIKSVSVSNYLGQEVARFEAATSFDLTGVANGIYQVLIETESGIFREELVIQE